jgi:3-oxoacyl-[acyl-carrier-protein] synthase-1
MFRDDVVILGVGMMTSVGLSALETAASVRAGIARFSETPWLDASFEPYVIAQVIEEGLPYLVDSLAEDATLSPRERRLLRLGTMPLQECLKPIALLKQSIGLMIALPEMEARPPLDPANFLKHLAEQMFGVLDASLSRCGPQGRAGGLAVIGEALRRIRDDGIDFVLVGGIDTYRDFAIIDRLEAEQRVKSSRILDGFIPGEGAGFLLLARRTTAEAVGLSPLAAIYPVTEGFEEGHFYSQKPYLGERLADVFERFFQGHSMHEPIQEVYASMNGENYWAKEWGVAFLRHQSAFSPELRMHHPADCFGDLGASCGPLLLGLAALGIRQGYRRSPCLVYCSSDAGERAVTAVRSL